MKNRNGWENGRLARSFYKFTKMMVDLVDDFATHSDDKRFLEPACGTGNFLIEVLRRKCDRIVSDLKAMKLWHHRNADA